jgi:hypothetical protein
VHEGKTLLYRASKLDCDVDVCPLKLQCCPKDPSRKIPRDIHERARTLPARLRTLKPSSSLAAGKKIEMRYPEARSASTARSRGAQNEFVLAAIAKNLRRLASLVARRHRWGPVYCVAWSCVEATGRSKPAVLNDVADGPPVAADFYSKICQQPTSPPFRIDR